MKRRKPPKRRQKFLDKYVVVGIPPASKSNDVKKLLAQIVAR